MWLKVVIDYDATSTGGARLGINGHSPPNWSVSGNYARSDGLQRLQLGDNNAGAADFDDLFLATTDGTGAGLPVDNSPPAVSGTPGQGQTLTATSGSWGGAGNKYWYSWQDCDRAGNNCVTISGATSSTYVVQSSDAGHRGGRAGAQLRRVGINPLGADSVCARRPSGLQSMAYWLGWEPNTFPEADLPWADLTRVTMFSLEVEDGPGLDTAQNVLNDYNMPDWTAMLHRAWGAGIHHDR